MTKTVSLFHKLYFFLLMPTRLKFVSAHKLAPIISTIFRDGLSRSLKMEAIFLVYHKVIAETTLNTSMFALEKHIKILVFSIW